MFCDYDTSLRLIHDLVPKLYKRETYLRHLVDRWVEDHKADSATISGCS